MDLYKKLEAYKKSDYYPFHMPGHKRNEKGMSFYNIDITEIDGFDNLHEPEEIILEEMQRAAGLFGAEESYFLVNGSSGGLLAAVSSAAKHGEEILIARNCHKAVYNAVLINELVPHYIYPQREEAFGINLGILPEDVDKALKEYPNCKTVVLVSPTYEGVVSDIKRIAEIVHGQNGILIVDEAHGAHFPFHKEFPASAVECGADIVIQSIHKTLPAPTQTAIAHVQGNRVSKEHFQQFLSVYQSTSPSYVLMAGMSRCMEILEKEGPALFEEYVKRLRWFYRESSGFKNITVLGRGAVKGFERDSSKLIISVKNTTVTGAQIYDILLQRYHLQMEMAADSYVLGMTSLFDTKEGFERLLTALTEMDGQIERKTEVSSFFGQQKPEQKMTPYQAFCCKAEWVSLAKACGRITGNYIYLYPPGVPLLCPGEIVDEECIKQIKSSRAAGLRVHGILEENGLFVRVLVK